MTTVLSNSIVTISSDFNQSVASPTSSNSIITVTSNEDVVLTNAVTSAVEVATEQTSVVQSYGGRAVILAPTGAQGVVPSLRAPVFTYTEGVLTSIAYADGETKTFTYVDGILDQMAFNDGSTLLTSIYNYNAQGVLTHITES